MCIDIIVNTIMTFPCYQKSNILKEIHLMSDEESTAAAFKISCEKFLGGNIPAAPLLSSITLNNVNIHIMEGYIEEQQVDVIVNCVPEQHSFPAGHRSNTILDQVGTELEKDFLKKLSESSNIQELVVTTGFHLSCQYVYHLIWPSYYNFLLPEWYNKTFKSELTKMKTKYMGEMAPKLNEESDKIFKVPQWSREGQKEAGFKEARPPLIHLKGNNEEQLAAAKKWIAKLLQTQECRFIENNHIFYLGKEEHDQLSYLKNYFEVSISEDISPGKATLEIRGRLNSIIPVMLHIENLLWHVQLDYAKKKFSKLTDLPFSIQSPEGNLVRANISKERIFQEKKKQFEKAGLEVQKVEAIQNLFLWAAIEERKKKIWSKNGNGNKSLMVYQEVPYQFCNLVSRVGFQRIYSMPPDPKYGYGIYFNKSLENLVKNLGQTSDSDNVICVFEAEVAIGSYCEGSHHYISPPLLGSRTMDTFDSVVDNGKNPETIVIFDSTQALPLFLWTCVLKSSFSPKKAQRYEHILFFQIVAYLFLKSPLSNLSKNI
ncbi:protein mono-ADP-ribosyltransferase PARP9-like isoform X2 [Antechinus flavipes]|uniref:protein mono-ADP-ribosyltransferase PARP9-like isoform X2 n=1 Tax=Antechinus flavipes TaxID=38775 RepID=UPI002235E8BA|nr:protein mono-ADP-ribosyltransferase PARP9-like isoform X2 [Antechinus flavipes]